jgi:SAM-dependent methyltransferase/uncharacterized protein YbaR (Trm112 family)
MKTKLLKILACPKCFGDLDCRQTKIKGEDIETGELICVVCKQTYPITAGIPRFVEPDNYASSFGYQWNLFRKEQIDSYNGTNLSAKRFWSETDWSKDELAGKWVLDAGCGAGRFLDVVSQTEAEVVGVDISIAVDAAKENLKDRRNVHLIQASIYDLPFREGTFDYVYCIGVIQHTPDPARTIATLPRLVKENGEIAVTIYPNEKWYTKLYAKYLVRPVTKRMDKQNLLRIIKGIMPVAFPVTSFLFRLPVVGRGFSFLIPIANYVNEPDLTKEQRYNWALLDTFDMLSPEFDQPQDEPTVRKILQNSGVVDVRRVTYSGVNLKGRRVAKLPIDETEKLL